METLQTTIKTARNATERKIQELGPWFHNIALPDGSRTAPDHPFGDFPNFKWEKIKSHIPEDLTGWKVLDIGCNAGFYSIQLAQRGAEVDAMDIDPRYLKQAAWVAGQFGLEDKITFKKASVYDLGRWNTTYDLVWFMGVFYHLRYPLLALDAVERCVKRLMVFQTLEMPGNGQKEIHHDLPIDRRSEMLKSGWPRMAFIEKKLANDWTNWWAPDRVCVEAMLRSAGLVIKTRPGDEMYVCEPDPDRKQWMDELRDADFLAAYPEAQVSQPPQL